MAARERGDLRRSTSGGIAGQMGARGETGAFAFRLDEGFRVYILRRTDRRTDGRTDGTHARASARAHARTAGRILSISSSGPALSRGTAVAAALQEANVPVIARRSDSAYIFIAGAFRRDNTSDDVTLAAGIACRYRAVADRRRSAVRVCDGCLALISRCAAQVRRGPPDLIHRQSLAATRSGVVAERRETKRSGAVARAAGGRARGKRSCGRGVTRRDAVPLFRWERDSSPTREKERMERRSIFA